MARRILLRKVMRITACLKLHLHLMGEEGDVPGKDGVVPKEVEEGTTQITQIKGRPKEEDKKQLIHLTLSIRTSSEISE